MGLLLIAPVSHFQSPGKDQEQTYRPIIIDHHEEMIIKWLRVVSLNYVMSCSQSLVLRYRNYLQLLYTNFNIFFCHSCHISRSLLYGPCRSGLIAVPSSCRCQVEIGSKSFQAVLRDGMSRSIPGRLSCWKVSSCIWDHMGVSYNGGSPKWMVYFMENQFYKWMIRGYPHFRKPLYEYLYRYH